MALKDRKMGGRPVWILRKYCSGFTSAVMLSFVEMKNRRLIESYVDYFHKCENNGDRPLFHIINIETVNRCNGTCGFCPANKNIDKRPMKKMTDELFHKIVEELVDIHWKGQIFLNINNEPLIDKNIIDKAKYIKERLEKNVCVVLITNGTLMNKKILVECCEWFDEICINNYSNEYNLTNHNRELYEYLKERPELTKDTYIEFRRRYQEEILATRAGLAPNKPKKNNKVSSACIYPYTDMTIYPDGIVGLCCNDCYEKTNFGDINEKSLVEIWNGKEFQIVRNKIGSGRTNYQFCKECDVSDSGFRERIIREIVRK